MATVIADLAERIRPKDLVLAAQADDELAYAQRLGHLLDLLGAADRAEGLAKFVAASTPRNIPLRPGRSTKGCRLDRRWRVILNEEIECRRG